MNKKKLRTWFIIVGIVAIILALIVFSGDVGSYVNSETYGGDAYTGIQRAAAKTANNVMYVGEGLQFGLGSILLVNGLVLIAVAISLDVPKKAAYTETENTEE